MRVCGDILTMQKRYGELKQQLKLRGYAIFPRVVDEQLCRDAFNELRRWHATRTTTTTTDPFGLVTEEATQQPACWAIRSCLEVRQLFAYLYEDDNDGDDGRKVLEQETINHTGMLCSMEPHRWFKASTLAEEVQVSPEERYNDPNEKIETRSGEHCCHDDDDDGSLIDYQAFVPLAPFGEDDLTVSVMPRSHLYHRKLFRNRDSRLLRHQFKTKKSSTIRGIRRLFGTQRLAANTGDLVVFDSRLIRCMVHWRTEGIRHAHVALHISQRPYYPVGSQLAKKVIHGNAQQHIAYLKQRIARYLNGDICSHNVYREKTLSVKRTDTSPRARMPTPPLIRQLVAGSNADKIWPIGE